MKHLIIGSGTVGKATGIWLEANKENVTFNDIDSNVLNKLKSEKHKTTNDILDLKYDVIWICTAEWNVVSVLKSLSPNFESIIVIRSTMSPGDTVKLTEQCELKNVVHIPEFLKEKTALDDIFNSDRIVIGTNSEHVKNVMAQVYSSAHVPIVFTDPSSSELIKLVSNCWLATQISFWNEVKQISDKLGLNPQEIANGCTLDHRISRYGSNMIGKPFDGFCFPKDTLSFVRLCKREKTGAVLMAAVRRVNVDVER